MNKNIINIVIKSFIVGFLTLQLMSCTDDFLNKNPLDQISSPSFWTSQKEADMALAGVYSRLQLTSFTFHQIFLDIIGGDAYGVGTAGLYQTLAQGYVETTSGGPVPNIYIHCYQGIASCNFFLENIDRTPISTDIITKYKGEVLFLRAYFYFVLTDFYGGVPLFTKSVAIDEAKVKQRTKEEVLTQIIADLDVAVASLPNTDYSSSGHAVKGSALALKARVLLYNKDWAGAMAAANQVITDGKFSLSNNYSTMFLTAGQGNNPEVMFSSRWLNPDNYQPLTTSQDVFLLYDGIFMPMDQLINEFECTDGLPITQSPLYDGSTTLTRKKNRDPRLVLSVKTFEEGIINSKGELKIWTPNVKSVTGWGVIKTCNLDNVPVSLNTRCDQDWVILRYADVLMMYAEAKNEVSGPDQSVYNAINAVRARPGINMPPIPTGLTKEQMRARIQHERRVEFCFEGLRYSDMKRWKLAETYIPTIVDPGGLVRQFNPSKHYLFPFPQSEIDVNPNLVQNPGY